MPVSAPKMRPSPTAISPKVIERREPGLGVVVDEQVEEVAIPVIADRGMTARGGIRDRDGVLPVAQERGTTVDPARAGELVQAGVEPREAEEDADRQPHQPGVAVAEQEARERRSLDLDACRRRARSR